MRIGIIHANANAIIPLNDVFHKIDPNIEIINFCNEELLYIVNMYKKVTDQALRLFARAIFDVADFKVDGIMVACSVYCSYIEQIKPFLSIPIVAVDDPALCTAAKRGGKIGILATTSASAPCCRMKLQLLAKEYHTSLEYEEMVVTEAMAALKSGNLQQHDKLLVQASENLKNNGCTTIILSQITMARAKFFMSQELQDIVLTTPEEGVSELLKQIHSVSPNRL